MRFQALISSLLSVHGEAEPNEVWSQAVKFSLVRRPWSLVEFLFSCSSKSSDSCSARVHPILPEVAMPHKHKRKRGENDNADFDLPPTAKATALPVIKPKAVVTNDDD